MNISYTTFF